MIWEIFTTSPKSFLGVDIGTFSIKVVELSIHGNRRKLDNYAEIQAGALYEKAFRSFEKSTLSVSNADVVRAIKAALQEARIKSNRVVFSIPDFSTFFTTFNLPPMTEEEIPQAVQYEARQHIPLPLSEVTLDWQVVDQNQKSPKTSPYKILLVAVPNEVIRQYQDIALNAGLELAAMEAEVFGLARAINSSEKEKGPVALVDIGARSTTISIVDKEALQISHSFDTSGNDFTDVVAKALRVTRDQAEKMKREYGLRRNSANTEVFSILLNGVSILRDEVAKHFLYWHTHKDEDGKDRSSIKKIILCGGDSNLIGLSEYLSVSIKSNVEMADVWVNIADTEKYIPQIDFKQSLAFASALGLALRNFYYD